MTEMQIILYVYGLLLGIHHDEHENSLSRKTMRTS